METIEIPGSVTSINSEVVYGCTNLKTITVGSGVKYLDDYAFRVYDRSDCKLSGIYFRGDAPGTGRNIIGKAFNFGVDWDQASQTISIDTSKGYTPG